MADYNFTKLEGLEETLSRLLNIQAQPGSDQDANLLLLSLVNLMGIVGIMQKQLSGQEINSLIDQQVGLAVNNGGAKTNTPQRSINHFRDKNEIVNGNIHSKEAPVGIKNNNKIVNKMKDKSDRNSKVIKWDSRFKKKTKEPI